MTTYPSTTSVNALQLDLSKQVFGWFNSGMNLYVASLAFDGRLTQRCQLFYLSELVVFDADSFVKYYRPKERKNIVK
jgi:hypothetical protein